MNSALQNFTYPVTCCAITTGFQSNWNSLPASSLESAQSCAVYGTGLYQTVSLFKRLMRKKHSEILFFFQGLL